MSQESMYIEIYKEIKADITGGKYRAGDILPTEAELAGKHFTSRITIRKAMSLLQNEGYINRIPGRGTFVSDDFIKPSGAKRMIGVILCNLGASFGLDLLVSIERKCTELGYNIIFRNSRDDSALESQAINELIDAGAEGIIIQPVHREYYNKNLIFHHFNKFPFVLVDRYFPGFSIPSISTNNHAAAAAMTEYIIGMGHKNICFVSSDPSDTTTIQDRVDGFKSTYIMKGNPLTECNLLLNIQSPHHGGDESVWRSDIENVKDHLTKHPELSCIFASEFTVAQLSAIAMRELDMKIGRDCSLATFDNTESVISGDPTRIEQEQTEIGRQAADILHRIICGEVIGDRLLIPHKLIEGNTVRRL